MTAKEYAKKHSDLDKPVTMGLLLEFTDEFLIPRFSDLMDQRIDEKVPKIIGPALAKLEYNLKSYIDDKMADYTSDIFKRLERKAVKEREFKTRIIDILRRNKLAKDKELSFLQGLVEGTY